jgi:hypothetical protein
MDMSGSIASGGGGGVEAPEKGATVSLTDIVGSREVTVTASIVIAGKTVSEETTVSFGKGPLSKFKEPVSNVTWDEAYFACNDSSYTGDSSTWEVGDNVGGGMMSTRAEYQAVSGSVGSGAALAAGWPYDLFWTGEADGANANYAVLVLVINGNEGSLYVGDYHSVACRR